VEKVKQDSAWQQEMLIRLREQTLRFGNFGSKNERGHQRGDDFGVVGQERGPEKPRNPKRVVDPDLGKTFRLQIGKQLFGWEQIVEAPSQGRKVLRKSARTKDVSETAYRPDERKKTLKGEAQEC
jgi:hypothetical protein